MSDDERRELRFTHWLGLITFGLVLGMMIAQRWDDLAAVWDALTALV